MSKYYITGNGLFVEIDSSNTRTIQYVDLDPDELVHFKYIKKVKLSNGKFRYYYDWDELKNDTVGAIKNKVTETARDLGKKSLTAANNVADTIDGLVNKGKKVINNFIDSPDNIYDVTSSSYSAKIEKIKNTEEWKKIVAKQDPEYVKQNQDGSISYNINKYLIDKKHPVLDIVGDILAGRKVDTNEITPETVVSGLKDYAIGTLRSGILGAKVATTVLTEKFKLQQGTYDDQITRLSNTIDTGSKYVDDLVGMGRTIQSNSGDVLDVLKSESNTLGSTSSVSKSTIENTAKIIAQTASYEASRQLNNGNIIAAARVIMQSDILQNTLGPNEYYKMAQNAISGLSDEEIMALNILLKELRGNS